MQLLELLRKTTEQLEKFGIDDALADVHRRVRNIWDDLMLLDSMQSVGSKCIIELNGECT